MSLEQQMAELTAALKENTAVQRELLGKVSDVDADSVESAAVSDDKPARKRGEPSPGKKRRTAAEVAEDEAAEKAEQEAAGKSNDTDSDADSDITFDGLKKELAGWLGEFAKEEDKDNPDGAHPEVKARRATLKSTLEKLGADKLPDIKDDQAKTEKLWNWLHDKAKTVDKGFGIGRLAEDPAPADKGGDEDDLDI